MDIPITQILRLINHKDYKISRFSTVKSTLSTYSYVIENSGRDGIVGKVVAMTLVVDMSLA
jgi:hypothetical protein